jgi:stearoyl-CoA desaturase (delta-9 desaturase)
LPSAFKQYRLSYTRGKQPINDVGRKQPKRKKLLESRTMANAPVAAEVSPYSARHLAFVLPLILLHLGCGLVFVVGWSGIAVTGFLVASALQVFGITAGYHRLLAHRSFRTTRAFQFLLALLGVLAGQNGPLWWVGHHRHHHAYSDREGDTHSPRTSFFWGHMGWLFSPRCLRVRIERVRDLAQLPELRLLERYYYLIYLGYLLMLYLLGEAWTRFDPHAGVSGAQLVVWAGVLSTVCVYHMIWSANSFCHRYGTRRFPTGDNSRNNLIVSLLTLGDGWHNNHHYCPTSARHGFRRWEIDINYAVLKLLAYCGIVWDLRLPPDRADS